VKRQQSMEKLHMDATGLHLPVQPVGIEDVMILVEPNDDCKILKRDYS